MSALSIREFYELHATIADAEKKSAHAALYGSIADLDREKARIDASRERLKYYHVAALLATLQPRQEALEAIAALERPRDSHPTTQHALMRERFTQAQEIARDALERGPPQATSTGATEQ